MDSSNPYFIELDEGQTSPELGGGDSSPLSSYKSTYLSPKKSSRRSIQKRVVSIPIKDVEGSRLKGESSAPPADSWAWRKYGQKPIKGSPYPRGYYRCSSSKGCPAKKQVERSRVDPTLLLITYSSEHNHLSQPASRSHHHIAAATSPARSAPINTTSDKAMILPTPVDKFVTPSEESLTLSIGDEFGWFADMSSTSASTILLESPIFVEASCDVDADMAMFFTIKEEDESLFADLGELPECSLVFRRGLREESRRWCGTT